jgi:hypothetical protein
LTPTPSLPTPAASTWEEIAPWHLQEVDENNLVIGVATSDPTCEEVARVESAEGPDSVQITAVLTILRSTACMQFRRYERVTVELDAPLGDRILTGCLLERAPASDPRNSCSDVYQGQ